MRAAHVENRLGNDDLRNPLEERLDSLGIALEPGDEIPVLVDGASQVEQRFDDRALRGRKLKGDCHVADQLGGEVTHLELAVLGKQPRELHGVDAVKHG